MSSDAELLKRIAELTGAIQQHRLEQSYNTRRRGAPPFRGGRGRATPYMRGSHTWVRGRGRGSLTGQPPTFGSPNKTLILNNNTKTSATPSSIPSPASAQQKPISDGGLTTTSGSPHRKLVLNQPSPKTVLPDTAVVQSVTPGGQKRIAIDGVSFIVKGKKLIREDRLGAKVKSLPASGSHVLVRRAFKRRRDRNQNMVVGKVPTLKKRIRSKNGNMVFVREPEGYVRQGRSGKSLVLKTKQMTRRHCGLFTRYGKCPNGPRCPFIHDPNRRAICPRFLQNRCRKPANQCRLSHTPTPHIMPHCVHFQRGRCTNVECPFMHVRVRDDAPVCRAFAMEGYCSKGLECRDKHIHVCPMFAETGKCPNANCRLPHVARRTANKEDGKASGIIRPGSWVSTAYLYQQKKIQEDKKRNAQEQQQQAEEATANTARKSREEEEEEGFVRLFDSDDDDEGWSQYFVKEQNQSEEAQVLRFSDKEDEQEEDEDEEEEEETDNENGSENEDMSDEEEYEEYEIADEDEEMQRENVIE